MGKTIFKCDKSDDPQAYLTTMENPLIKVRASQLPFLRIQIGEKKKMQN
jgi:hypothetical protein